MEGTERAEECIYSEAPMLNPCFPGNRKADFSFHSLNNCYIGFFKGSKGKPEAAPSGFQRRAPQTIGSSTKLIIFTMASGCLQGRRPFSFVSGASVLPLVWGEFLRLPTMLEGASLLFQGVSPFRTGPSSQGSTKALPANAKREESSPARGESPPSRVEQKE
jgi:hypothetical protein